MFLISWRGYWWEFIKTLHTTTLILVNGALDAHSSKLMPDKKIYDYNFSCDGPRQGGTCDISAWDAFYLVVFTRSSKKNLV
ncbi:photosystem I P700 chlorophyll A apoprotein [Medicago truncatula]|uniref:Photosystem I P700 chlorophyll A apoprotein n=1 Tax=Medicago truncatula TaxID=3880 RepID=G7L6U0_MEDTR|nr:photosystem I P700 chlorophyll A apoprotein [Medicago truncatula]